MAYGLQRRRFADRLLAKALSGRTVLLLGPVGNGKTTILREVARDVRARGIPCGLAPRTATLRDVTAALAEAYPTVQGAARTQRSLRGSLRLAVDGRPGVLLLDHLVGAGTATRGYLRSLQGTGLGVVIVADMDTPRDKARVRDLRLGHDELEVPRVGGRTLMGLLDSGLGGRTLPGLLSQPDRRRLVDGARGCPGRIVLLLHVIGDPAYWRDGRPLCVAMTEGVRDMIFSRGTDGLDERLRGVEG